MFDSKKKSLVKVEKTSNSTFVQAGLKESARILTGNGGEAYSTSGNPFVDQFTKTSIYRELRSFTNIAADCEQLWAINKQDCVKFMFFLRTICRKVQGDGFATSIAQKGSELRHEPIMRLLWLHAKDSEVFWKNAWLIPLIGSWKDLFVMLRYDLIYHGWEGRVLNWDKFADLILSGLKSETYCNLIKKYLPAIKSNKDCHTVEAQANCMIAKWLCFKLYGKVGDSFLEKYTQYRNYARMKASGTAHTWQQLISKGKFDLIDFDQIHGRALNLLVNSKFLYNHNLRDKYTAWVSSPETKEVKYTGFVHELFAKISYVTSLVNIPTHIQETINKQFMTLVNKCKDDGNETGLIVVRDTSGSMSSIAKGTNVSCHHVAKALALYFSYFLTGHFADAWIEFNSTAQMHTWQGDTPIERWCNDRAGYIGSTDFLSVIRLFADIKKSGVPESDFPKGILAISDCEFDASNLNQTSVEQTHQILRDAGFSEDYINNFVVCLWNLSNHYYGRGDEVPFQTYGDIKNVYYMSGYSAQIVSFLNGKIQTTYDLFKEAMDQEVLNMIQM